MGKISGEVSKGLGSAIAESKAKLNCNEDGIRKEDTEALLNSGVEAQKKRKKRSKAKSDEENSLIKSLIPEDDGRPEWEKRSAINHDEFCEWELEKAKLKGVPEPDFDFRSYYEKGETVWFVRVLGALGDKEIRKLYLRTIYPRLIIGSEAKTGCQCIGYNERDLIFRNYKDAEKCYKSIKLTSKYSSEEPENKRKRHKGTDEEPESENSEYEASMSSEEDDTKDIQED